MSFKGALLLLLIVIVVVGATSGPASAAAIGDAVGSAVRWIAVAWNAAVDSTNG